MSWAGTAQSGLFWTVNTGGGIARVDWEFPGGDVSGVIDNLIVIGLRGQGVSPDIPASGDVLYYDGAAWTPTGLEVLVSGIPHNLLSTTHPDTIPGSPVDGDLIAGSGTPASWTRFPLGDDGHVLTVASGGNLSWQPPGLSDVEILSIGSGISLDENNRVLLINKTPGSATTVQLPVAPYIGQQLVIKDGKGDAHQNNIHIYSASATIDGNSAIYMGQNYQSFTLLYNGTEWNII